MQKWNCLIRIRCTVHTVLNKGSSVQISYWLQATVWFVVQPGTFHLYTMFSPPLGLSHSNPVGTSGCFCRVLWLDHIANQMAVQLHKQLITGLLLKRPKFISRSVMLDLLLTAWHCNWYCRQVLPFFFVIVISPMPHTHIVFIYHPHYITLP